MSEKALADILLKEFKYDSPINVFDVIRRTRILVKECLNRVSVTQVIKKMLEMHENDVIPDHIVRHLHVLVQENLIEDSVKEIKKRRFVFSCCC